MTRFLMVLSIMGLAFSVPAMLDYDVAYATGGHHNGDNGDDDGDDGEDNGDGDGNGHGGDDGDGGDPGEGNGEDNGDSPGTDPDPGPGPESAPEASAEPAGEGETRVVDQEGATTNDRDDLLRFLKNGVNTLVRVGTSPPCLIEQTLSFGDSAETCWVLAVFDTTPEE